PHTLSRHSPPTRRSSDLTSANSRLRQIGSHHRSRRRRVPGSPDSPFTEQTGHTICIPFQHVRLLYRAFYRKSHRPPRPTPRILRSEEHTSELQSPDQLVC